MTRSSSLLDIQYALITALADDDTDLYTHTADRVYDYVPENAISLCPYLHIAGPTEVPWDFLGDVYGERTTFTVHIWSTYRGSKEVKEIVQHINDILDNQTLTVSGYDVPWTYNTFTTDIRDPGGTPEGGVLWHGIMTFMIYVVQT